LEKALSMRYIFTNIHRLLFFILIFQRHDKMFINNLPFLIGIYIKSIQNIENVLIYNYNFQKSEDVLQCSLFMLFPILN